jgi:hypothetical protein
MAITAPKSIHNLLADEIEDFLLKHAHCQDSPDVRDMRLCVKNLRQGYTPKRCWSEWNPEAYQPYQDIAARRWHDSIINRLFKRDMR